MTRQWDQRSRIAAGERYYTAAKLTAIDNFFWKRRTMVGGIPDTCHGTPPVPPTITEISKSELLYGPSPLDDPTEEEAKILMDSECHEAVLSYQTTHDSVAVGRSFQACALTFYSYMSHLYLLTVSDQVYGHHLLGGHNIQSSLISQLNGAAALVLHKLATAGWMSGETRNKTTLQSYRATRGDAGLEMYYMFILPCVIKLVHTMNPHNYFNIETILNINIGSWENSLKKKASSFGVWDRLLVEEMVRKNAINDGNMCRGVRYEVARFLSCTMVGFSRRWSRVASQELISSSQMNSMDDHLSPFFAPNQVAVRR